jgi:hypothetical protein
MLLLLLRRQLSLSPRSKRGKSNAVLKLFRPSGRAGTFTMHVYSNWFEKADVFVEVSN